LLAALYGHRKPINQNRQVFNRHRRPFIIDLCCRS
jgi:hypothetical protein